MGCVQAWGWDLPPSCASTQASKPVHEKKKEKCRYPIRIQAPPHVDDEIQPSPKQSDPMPPFVIAASTTASREIHY